MESQDDVQQKLSEPQILFTQAEFERQVLDFGEVLVRQMLPQPEPASGGVQMPLELQNFEQHWLLELHVLFAGAQLVVPASTRQV